jgi:hypothetical protein
LLYAISVAPTAQGSFGNAISMTCASGLPAGSTCSFARATISLSSAAASVSTLTIYTSGKVKLKKIPGSWEKELSGWLGGPLLCVAFGVFGGKGRRRRSFMAGASSALLGLAAVLCSCSSPSVATTPQTYSVTVIGSSNQLQHNTVVSFTVQ